MNERGGTLAPMGRDKRWSHDVIPSSLPLKTDHFAAVPARMVRSREMAAPRELLATEAPLSHNGQTCSPCFRRCPGTFWKKGLFGFLD